MPLDYIPNYSDIYSPQMGAITGREQYIPREKYVREMAQYLPQIYAVDEQRRLQEEQVEREREALKEAKRQRNIGSAIEVGNTIGQAGGYKPMYNLGRRAFSEGFMPEPLMGKGVDYATAGFGTAPPVGSGLNAGMPPYLAGSELSTTLPQGTQVAGQAVGQAGQAAQTGFQGFRPESAIGQGLAGVGTGIVGTQAGRLVERSNFGEWAKKQGIMGEKEADIVGGVLGGAATGAAYGSAYLFPGVGTLAGALFGGIAGGTKNACIIVTTCTDPDSHEVNIARAYRDKFLDDEEKRGYYMLAEKIVPRLKEDSAYKKYIKETLVDKLIDYGEVTLGEKDSYEYEDSIEVTEKFIEMCKRLGSTCSSFTRSNGEVV